MHAIYAAPAAVAAAALAAFSKQIINGVWRDKLLLRVMVVQIQLASERWQAASFISGIQNCKFKKISDFDQIKRKPFVSVTFEL
jgi:hypothetical protein